MFGAHGFATALVLQHVINGPSSKLLNEEEGFNEGVKKQKSPRRRVGGLFTQL